MGVGPGHGGRHLRLGAHRAHGGNASLRQAGRALVQAAPLLLQVGTTVQLGRNQTHGKGARLAQGQRDGGLGQQRVRDAARDEQLHRLHGRGHVAQAKVAQRVQPLPGRQQLQHDVGHVTPERHGDFLALVVLQRLARGVARDNPQRAPGGDVEQRDAGPAVAEVGGHVAGHGQHVGLAAHGHHAQLVGVAPGAEHGALRDILERLRFGHVDQRRRDDGRWPGQRDLRQRRGHAQRGRGCQGRGQPGQGLAAVQRCPMGCSQGHRQGVHGHAQAPRAQRHVKRSKGQKVKNGM